MKHILLPIILIFSSILSLSADEPDTSVYHVIAESGLFLRSDKGLDSEKLALIPYEDTLLVVGMYLLTYESDKVTIDGKEGHWLPAIYQGTEGFIFTAYVRRGLKYIPDNPNLLYRIVFDQTTNIPLNYAPGLYWYGFYIDSTDMTMYIEAVELSMELAKEQYDYEDPYSDRRYYEPVTNNSRKAKFYVGMKKAMESSELKSWYFHDKENQGGKFLYPYESMELSGLGTYMNLKPVVIPTLDTLYDGKVRQVMAYTLQLHSMSYSLSENNIVFDLPKLTDQVLDANMHAIYRNPRILWKGDLNEDGIQDLIIRTSYMSEQCGGSEDYHILISKQKGAHFRLIKAGGGNIFHEGC